MTLRPTIRVAIDTGHFWDRKVHAVFPFHLDRGIFTFCGIRAKRQQFPSAQISGDAITCPRCERLIKCSEWLRDLAALDLEERLEPVLSRLEYAINLARKKEDKDG
jgi:hypothetical protein